MGLLPTQKPATAGRWVCVGGSGAVGRGGLKLVLPQLDNGWGWGGVTTYPETCHSWSMGVCVRRGEGGGEKGSWGGG